MFYRKNVSKKERIVRFIAGGLMVLCGLFGLHATTLGLFVAGVGVVTLLTGGTGYCPACAMVGKKPVEPIKPIDR